MAEVNNGPLGPETTAKILEEQIDDAIIMAGDDMLIVYANRAAELMFGYPREKLLGKNIRMLVPAGRRAAHDAGVERFWKAPAPMDIRARAGFTSCDSKGREFAVEIKLIPFKVGEERLVTAIIKEVAAPVRLSFWDKVMRGITPTHVGLLSALFAAIYAIGATLGEPWQVFRIVNPLVIAVGAGLLIAFSRSLWEAVSSKVLAPAHLLVFGIYASWAGIIIRSGAWYLTGATPPSNEIWIWLGAIMLALLGGLLHVAAVEAAETRWPPRYFLMAIVLSFITTASLLFFW
jgi:PAS domain S-box-containing protein